MDDRMRTLSERKDALWSFMWKVKELPGLLDQLEINGNRLQIREMERLLTIIREME